MTLTLANFVYICSAACQRNMQDYKILSGPSATALMNLVNDHLWKGYLLVGGLAYADGYFYQAVAKPIRDR